MKPIQNVPFFIMLLVLLQGIASLVVPQPRHEHPPNRSYWQHRALIELGRELDARHAVLGTYPPGEVFYGPVIKVPSLVDDRPLWWSRDVDSTRVLLTQRLYWPLSFALVISLLVAYGVWERLVHHPAVPTISRNQGRLLWAILLLLLAYAISTQNPSRACHIVLLPTVVSTAIVALPWAWFRFYKYYFRDEKTPRDRILIMAIVPLVAQLALLVVGGAYFYVSRAVESDEVQHAYRMLTDGRTYYVLHAPGLDFEYNLDFSALQGGTLREVALYLHEQKHLDAEGKWPFADISGDFLLHNLPRDTHER